MKNLIFITFLIITNTMFSQNNSIGVVGSWTKNIDASTISDAGNDYPSAFTSASNQTQISVGIKNKNFPVYIYVHKEDATWNSNLILKVRRTSNGTNNNTLVRPVEYSSFQTITNTGTISPYLFSCEGYDTIVPLQYEITGLSVLLPVQSYSTTVIYTITNLEY